MWFLKKKNPSGWHFTESQLKSKSYLQCVVNATYPLRLESFGTRLHTEGQDSVWGKLKQIKGKTPVSWPGGNVQN